MPPSNLNSFFKKSVLDVEEYLEKLAHMYHSACIKDDDLFKTGMYQLFATLQDNISSLSYTVMQNVSNINVVNSVTEKTLITKEYSENTSIGGSFSLGVVNTHNDVMYQKIITTLVTDKPHNWEYYLLLHIVSEGVSRTHLKRCSLCKPIPDITKLGIVVSNRMKNVFNQLPLFLKELIKYADRKDHKMVIRTAYNVLEVFEVLVTTYNEVVDAYFPDDCDRIKDLILKFILFYIKEYESFLVWIEEIVKKHKSSVDTTLVTFTFSEEKEIVAELQKELKSYTDLLLRKQLNRFLKLHN